MAVQTRHLSARNDFAGDAIVGAGFVLVANDAGRALHAPLPDDERACVIGHDSRCTRKWLLLPSLRRQADPGFNASGSKRQQRWAGPDI